MAQVRKDQRVSQRDIADYLGVSLNTVRQWEGGTALPDRSLWSKVEEAMGMPVPDPRVPQHTPAERELIDTILVLVDEMRLLRERLGEIPAPAAVQPVQSPDPKLLDVKAAASYLGVSTSFIRNLVGQRSVVHYKVGRRLLFRSEDIDQLVERNKRDLPDLTPWQLQGRRGKSPRNPTPKGKPARVGRPKLPRMSKEEIAEKRWTIEELGERWYGTDSAANLIDRAGIILSEGGNGRQVFRYGDLLAWMEGHNAEFAQWLEEFGSAPKGGSSQKGAAAER